MNQKGSTENAEAGISNSRRRRGEICVLVSALLFSTGGLIFKYIPWPPLAINSARNLIAIVVLSSFLAITKHKLKFNRWILFGSLSYAATSALFVMANKMTTAANSIILQFTAPVFVVLLSWAFLRRRPSAQDILACVFVFAGIICFFIDGLKYGGTTGNIVALLSGVTYAVLFMCGTFSGADPLSTLFYGEIIAAVVCSPSLTAVTDFAPRTLTALALCGLFQMGTAYMLLMCGLETTPPVVSSLISSIEPILNPIWVALFYGEMIKPLSLVGAVIVFVTVIIYNLRSGRSGKKDKTHPIRTA